MSNHLQAAFVAFCVMAGVGLYFLGFTLTLRHFGLGGGGVYFIASIGVVVYLGVLSDLSKTEPDSTENQVENT